MALVSRTHTIYISSKYRNTGTTSNYDVVLPNMLESDPKLNKFKVTLQSFSCYNSWYLVREGSNIIWLDNVEVTIPDGTYTYQRLSRVLEAYTGASVQWSPDSNKMRFTFDTSTTVIFDGLGTILGFTPDTPYTGTTIISETAMTPYEYPYLVVHLNNITPMAENVCLSNHTGEMRACSILGKVAINASPFQLITYEQVLESQGVWTSDNTLGKLEILIADSDGNELTHLPEHEMTLRVEVFDIEDADMKDVIAELKDMKNTLKDIFLFKAVKYNNAYGNKRFM